MFLWDGFRRLLLKLGKKRAAMPDYFVLINIFLDKIFSDFVLLFSFDSSDGTTSSL